MIYHRIGQTLGLWIVRYRWTTLALSVGFFCLLAVGLPKARFSTDYRIFFSKDDAGLEAFQKLESVFTKTDNVLFVVKARSGTVFQAPPLAAVQEITTAGWMLPYASRVDSLTNFQEATAQADEITVRELVNRPAATLTPDDLARIHDQAVAEPLLAGSLLSRDQTTCAVNVTLRLPGKQPSEVTEASDAARRIVAEMSVRYPGLDIRASGMALMNDAFMQTSIRDLAVMIPLMISVMLLAMVWITRSAWATASVALILSLSAALSVAVAGWLRYPLTPPAVAAPIIVLTVAVADGVHLVLAVMGAIRSGASREAAIVSSMRTNLEPMTYTWLTTVVGFVCLNFSDAPPVTHLANMTSFGVTMAFVYSFTLLPALLSLLPLRAPAPRTVRGGRPAGSVFEGLTDLVIRRRVWVIVACSALALGCGALASQLEQNDQFVKYFDRSVPFRRDVDFTLRNLSGIYRLEYQIGSGAPSGIADPAYLQNLDSFGDWLRAQPEVEHVYSLADLLKRVNRVIHGDDVVAYRIPASRDEASQELLLYEMGLPVGLDLTDRINVDKSAARLTVTVKDLSTRQMNAFAARCSAWMQDHLPRPMWSAATGPVVIFSALSERNARAMIKGDLASLLLISVCMILVLRNFKLGMLSVIPNVVPIVVGYGIWRLAVGQLNIVATVAGSISLGIIVDDTIHFLTKYQSIQRGGALTAAEAMKRTLAHVGPAMIGTSIILVLGFGVLTLSSFQMTSYLGWLSVLIVGVAPLADLILAPALIVLLSRGHFETSAPARETKRDFYPFQAGVS